MPVARFCAIVLCLLTGASAPAEQEAAADPAPRAAFELRRSATLSLHMLVRKAAEHPATAETAQHAGLDGLDEAMQAVRALDEALGGWLAWGMIQPLIAEADDVAAMRSAFADLREHRTLRDGREVPLRARALAYADALAPLEPGYRERLWPNHQAAIARGEQRVRNTFRGREADCIAHLVESLGMQDPGVRVPSYLVAEAPFPEAFTHRGRDGPVCIVGVAEPVDSLLAENLLHEFIHALDVAGGDRPSVLNDLRLALREAGVPADDPAHRDVPHTLMFVQAAATVRRLLDDQHVDYGEARGYYPKVPAASAAVREVWTRRLAGELTQAEAIAEIVRRATQRDAAE